MVGAYVGAQNAAALLDVPGAPPAAAPEPATLVLLLSGMGLIAARRRYPVSP
ncbi:MAG TPA: PEP-CTERM sorting domain-containing protein [Accumulibacter sp.]|nr:PEP-CTERM sorting domain-containing protein [Accumulibacter sp.]